MTDSDSPAVLRIVAALVVDERGRALLVRKRGTTRFMQPGGKPEAGETDAAALARELQEELGLVVDPDELVLVGRYSADAANEADTVLDARVFDAPIILGPIVDTIEVAQEIVELVWVDPADPGAIALAPLSSEILLPLLASRNSPVE
ncbi:NUDIX hydrolase [Lacisediminihabitans changchengi]|uniref:NUDIX domain-containing protein n=1 Tax=Lacisediminihabitans changchengi TaxID=2787634 RepID=A0A934SHT1_9MICO|nr:NUDIX domain-containing protein [Lacisediminihabitans changchengi]MBK4346881.1 NUDIX domain-containing protein [Lacisediminihabitans changchengi]MBK4347996.1 NUDIX domain-containing protein [Lacisediminihabitans changchengi]